MAHIAKLGALTEELVTLITSLSPQSDPRRFIVCRDTSLRALRQHSFNRTNQFLVQDELEGLDEKLRVYNEDPLADALKERLKKLSSLKVKWEPEILHLLLELSNKPVFKSKLEDLNGLIPPEEGSGPPLKWKDLIAEDPLLREKSVWKNVDFAADSSDDEDNRSDLSDDTGSTVQSTVDDEHSRRPQDFIVDTSDEDALQKLRKAQFWQKPPNINGVQLKTVRKPVTELQAVREVLFMLSGSSTSLFKVEHRVVSPSKSYTLKHLSAEGYDRLMETFASHGSAIALLRAWAKSSQKVPLLQIFQSSTSPRLLAFDSKLSEIQQNFVAPSKDIVVSLLSVQVEIFAFLRPLEKLANMIKRLLGDKYAHAFRYLEFLYDETCTSQMAGDDEMYAFMGSLFFECFQVYLRPIRTWMEEGELSAGDNVFFVSELTGHVEPSSIWQSRFKLRKTQAGILHAPGFLHTVAEKIFTTGKSVVVLKELNQFESIRAKKRAEPRLDFATVCDPARFSLAPFSELFDVAFEDWIRSKHHYASNKLRQTLFDACGLHNALQALSHVYFISDGIASSNFLTSVFDKLDTLDTSWNDRFALTELAQETVGSVPSVASERLRILVKPLSQRSQEITRCRRSVKALSIIEPKYHLSWPIQIILTPSTIPSYQKVFTLLFQIRRSSHILSRERLIADPLNTTSTTDERSLYYALRTRLLWFNYTLYYYLTTLVLSPLSQKMHQDLQEAEDVDAMIAVHSTFAKRVVNEALLGSKLELIHKTVLKLLDMCIKLGDAQAENVHANQEQMRQQQESMDLSMASLGLPPTPLKRSVRRHSFRPARIRSSSPPSNSDDDDDDKEIEVDLSILSPAQDDEETKETYVEKLRGVKADFDRLVRFVGSGLKGVARASGGEEAKSWDVLGEMIEGGLDGGGGWRE